MNSVLDVPVILPAKTKYSVITSGPDFASHPA